MSSRQLRKLQKQKELEEAQTTANQQSEDEDVDDGDAVESIASKPKPRVSLFAALGGEDDVDDEDDEEQEVEAAQKPVAQATEDPLPLEQSKSKKKKKKKKKAKAKAAVEPEPEPEGDSEDEIDKAIKELKLTTGKKSVQASQVDEIKSQTRVNELLSINTHHLKAMNEMRHLFGRDIIESAQAEEEQEQNRRQRGGPAQRQVDLETFLRGPPGQKKLPEVSLRRNVFIQGREHWPMATAGGLTMQKLGKAPDGSHTEYAYQHDKDYDALQAIFFQYVGMGDPMRMVYLLQQVRKSEGPQAYDKFKELSHL